LSLERVLKILENFGLARSDAEVYVYLAKKGSRTGKEVANAMKLPKAQIYRILESLQKRGFISTEAERPAFFSALAFEQILDMIITLKDEEAQAIKETRGELLSSWRTFTRNKKQVDT
jgi:sugar-specific transcriptional regulator TrmB